jgi:hypothetical protein
MKNKAAGKVFAALHYAIFVNKRFQAKNSARFYIHVA